MRRKKNERNKGQRSKQWKGRRRKERERIRKHAREEMGGGQTNQKNKRKLDNVAHLISQRPLGPKSRTR
jgi:hypothetical protein